MMKSFRHKGLEKFFKTGSKAGIQAQHAGKLRIELTALGHATNPKDMNAPGWRFHRLSGDLAGVLFNIGERCGALFFGSRGRTR